MTDPEHRMLKISPRDDVRSVQRYMDADILSVLLILRRDGRTGREALAERVGVGYGSIRTILKTLYESKLVTVYQTGSILSPLGKRFMEACPIALADCTLPGCSVGGVQMATIVRDSANGITNGMPQRDYGIYAGGLGCTTLIYDDGKLFMPPDVDVNTMYPDSAEEIIRNNDLSDGDVIILGEGSDEASALRAAVVAAMHTVTAEHTS